MTKLTRRQFASTVAASTIALQIKSARAEVGPNDRIRIGAIGYGKRGMGDLAEFLKHPEVECPIVCDVDDAHLAEAVANVEAQRGNRPETVKDFRHVIDRNDLDAVLVATPDHWHALPTIHACETGKDVYVEKPLARTIDEGRAILEATRQNKRVVQMGTQWRSSPTLQEAVNYVQSGKLGKIRFVRAWAYLDWMDDLGNPPDGKAPEGVDYDRWLGPAPERPFNPNRFHRAFRWYWDYAGGLMTDWGVHLLNVCLWAQGLETPLRVSSMGGRYALNDNTETPDTQTTLYEFPTYSLIWEHQVGGALGPGGKASGICLSGLEGAMLIEGSSWKIIPEPGRNNIEAEEHEGGGDDRIAHVQNFLDCMGSREQPVENPEIGHHVSTVAHLGNIALRSRTELHWDAEVERITNDANADALVGEPYRQPWTLPYARRG